MKAQWHHLAISVRDIAAITAFYCEILGFEIEWERPDYNGEKFSNVVGLPRAKAHVVMLQGHGVHIELFQYRNPQGCAAPENRQCDFGYTHFALSVSNIQIWYRNLLQSGVRFNCPPQKLRAGVWATYLRDPEGNTIELIEYLEATGSAGTSA